MRDMTSVYFNMSVKELKTLRSKKVLSIERERQRYGSYASAQEVKRLAWAITRIDAVIAAKLAQMELPE
jgi:hypothetical protein